MKKIIFFLVILTLSSHIFSQDNLKFSAQIRPRFIIDNKDFNSYTSFESYGEMRSRFGIQFKPTKGLSLFFQVQDSRTFGEEPGTISNNKNLDVHQAYLQVNNLFNLPLNMKAGRMEAAYGTERIMSKNNWNNIGRSFDGLTLQISICTTNKSYLDLFAFRVGERGFPEDSLDENVLGIFADLQIFEGHKIQPFIVYRSSASASYPFNAFSVGTYLTGKINNFSHQAEFISQFGEERENGEQTLSVFFAGYNAAYKFNCEKQPYFSAGIDYYSGDDDLTDNKYKEFSRWFGAGHKYLGYMDYFPNNTFGIGLMDLHIKAGLLLFEKLGLNSAVHIFKSAEDFTLFNNSISSNFGTEIDVVLTYDYSTNLLFEMGGGLFLPGAIFEEKLGADNSTWFYIMAVADL
jgi:hypothetical protein